MYFMFFKRTLVNEFYVLLFCSISCTMRAHACVLCVYTRNNCYNNIIPDSSDFFELCTVL